MAVGGGMAIDQPSVPIREKCGLGQISGYVVSNASELATDQVDPTGTNTDSVTSGWYLALAKAYPKAVKVAGMGGSDTPSDLQPETKYEFGAEADGWKVAILLPRLRWRTGRPTWSSTSKGGHGPVAGRQRQLHPLCPGDDDRRLPPRLRRPGNPVRQLPDGAGRGGQPQPASHLRRDAVVATLNGLAEPFDRRTRHHHAQVLQGRRDRLQ